MKTIYKLLYFAIFFNIAAWLIAASGFFPAGSLYGDMTTYDLGDPDDLPSPEEMFTRLVTNSNDEVAKLFGVTITFTHIMGSILIASVGIAVITRSTVTLAIGLLGVMYVLMWSNSKRLFESMLGDMNSIALYFGLMIGLGVLILVVIEAMDMASGQRSTGG